MINFCNDRLDACDYQIPRIKMGSITYADFFEKYLRNNKPCIIYDVTKDWTANTQWVDIQNKMPNFSLLQKNYGGLKVPVVDFNTVECIPCTKKNVLFCDYLKYWKDLHDKKTFSITYLKDWHLRKERPRDIFYKVPEYFSSDWLNEYATDKEIDDYMFVYMGPTGSWTPFHVDVFKSFSWSANVLGKKRWLLFPPGEEKKYLDSFGNLPTNIENVLDQNSKFYEIIQQPGEAIFVPSGWYHQVSNIEDAISVNHNWINSCNVEAVWNYLIENLNSVENEIQEFRDTDGWTEHCQLMLRALFGMNICDFINFIKHITYKRILYLKSVDSTTTLVQNTLNTSYINSDLNVLEKVFKTISTEIKSRNLEKIFDSKDLSQIIQHISVLTT